SRRAGGGHPYQPPHLPCPHLVADPLGMLCVEDQRCPLDHLQPVGDVHRSDTRKPPDLLGKERVKRVVVGHRDLPAKIGQPSSSGDVQHVRVCCQSASHRLQPRRCHA